MATIGYKELRMRDGQLCSSWAKKEFLLHYFPNCDTTALPQLIEKGFGIFYWLTAEDALRTSSKSNSQVWEIEIDTVMPLPEFMLACPTRISELDAEYRWINTTAPYKDKWGMTNKVTLIERIK